MAFSENKDGDVACVAKRAKSRIFFISVLAMSILSSSKADYYVAQNGQTPASPYTAWNSAASNIQDAVNAAAANDTVWIGAGRYTVPPNATNCFGTNVVFINRGPLILRSSNGVPEDVLIDGGGSNRVIMIDSPTVVSRPFVLDGLTVCNGYATNNGGGILIGTPGGWNNYTTVVQNCVIRDNTVVRGTASTGGGIYSMYAKGLVASNTAFLRNRATGESASSGGAIYHCVGSTVAELRLTDCLVASNTAGSGGGIYGSMTTMWLDHCVIRDNVASNGAAGNGGGVYLSNPQILTTQRNCLVYGNVAIGNGGGIYWERKNPVALDNCTIVCNSASTGGGIRLSNTSSGAGLRICNSIIYSNTPADLALDSYTNAFFINSCLGSTNNLLGTGNITNNPRFVDFAGRNFRLIMDSACVNYGINQSWMNNARDMDSHLRIDRFSRRVDLGCYECLPQGVMFKIR